MSYCTSVVGLHVNGNRGVVGLKYSVANLIMYRLHVMDLTTNKYRPRTVNRFDYIWRVWEQSIPLSNILHLLN